MATYAAYRHVELDNVGYGKKRVLKPPGGGSSDIFGANEVDSPRRVKQNYNQSQLGSSFFGEQVQQQQVQQQQQHQQHQQPSSNGSSVPESPRSKSGNGLHSRLFGPPDAPPPSNPNSINHMRSNITLSSSNYAEPNLPARLIGNGSNENLLNGNGVGDIIGGSSCIPRNPVTGDGVDVVVHMTRRMIPRSKDGNPVTGTGYDLQSTINPTVQHNGNGVGGDTPSIGSDKSSTDSSPSARGFGRMKNRVPPGGYSSGLW